MTNEQKLNGDTAIIVHRLDAMKGAMDAQAVKQEQYHEQSQRRFTEQEKQSQELKLQTALQQQSHEVICKTVDANTDKIDKNDFWTKIIGAITGVLILAGTMVALISELMKGR
jgi:hypothetical protein